jgi:hypothetical protein
MTMTMKNGTIVQRSSRAREPWIATPTSSRWRRRYLTAKNTTRPAIRIEKNADTATMKK